VIHTYTYNIFHERILMFLECVVGEWVGSRVGPLKNMFPSTFSFHIQIAFSFHWLMGASLLYFS